VPAEGGSEPELKISASQGRLFSPSPTADGRSVYFWHRGDTYRWMVGDPAERIEAVEETREAELGAVPSPNGRWLAFVSREQGQPRLVVRSTDPARPQLHTIWDTGTRGGIRWNSDGTELFWVSQDSMRVARVNSGEVFSASPVQALFPMGRMSPEFDVSADGRFIMARRLTRLEQPPRLMLLQDWKARLPQ
jgi:Tol biopolymer transport system component